MPTEVEAEPIAVATPMDWESRISGLLSTLSAVQGDLLALLAEKRTTLAAGHYDQLGHFTQREAELVVRLETCHRQRNELLEAAAREGLPAGSVRSLAKALPESDRDAIDAGVEQARKQSRLLQHHSLTNWVVVQRTLIHLSQMIEIIATGGRMQPTYGAAAPTNTSGALVDRQA